ncbi:hypothetical protein [Limnobacter sp.]|uniref:hypothetical protein n=1 Tax=Limnobacter sp. TaxID=2003368 RepID=UPI0035151F28
MTQRKLDESALKAFYHEAFVSDQLRDFSELTHKVPIVGVVVDIGGGCGFFADGLAKKNGLNVRVLDMDPVSVDTCRMAGIDAKIADAVNPPISGDESIVCFNLILHHMVADSESATKLLQQKTLEVWRQKTVGIFVNEYIYESWIGNASGWLIYQVTKSKVLSAVGKLVSKVFPVLKANTFGIGVRFRAHKEWISFFKNIGFEVKKVKIGTPERVALPLRILLIREIRRDSFWLESQNDVERLSVDAF